MYTRLIRTYENDVPQARLRNQEIQNHCLVNTDQYITIKTTQIFVNQNKKNHIIVSCYTRNYLFSVIYTPHIGNTKHYFVERINSSIGRYNFYLHLHI